MSSPFTPIGVPSKTGGKNALEYTEGFAVFMLMRQNRMSEFAARIRAAQGERTNNIRSLLAQAGWRSNEALGIYYLARFISPFVFAAGAFIYYFASPAAQELPMLQKIAYFGGAGYIGIALPDSAVNFLSRRRQAKILGALPDALDLMIVCTEAGLSLDATFDRVSQEMMGTNPEMADELSLTSVEMAIMPRRSDALDNLVKRTDVPALESVVSTLNQTERYGTPLAQSFRILSADFRDARMLRAEEKAAKLPATLTVPMIAFIFPCLFIVLLGPAYIQTTERLAGGL